MSRLGFSLGWRFYRARQSNQFISFISFASTLGIALGVSVLIILLSAMNGFEHELEKRLLGFIPHAEVMGVNAPITDWQRMVSQAQAIEGIESAAPFVNIQGLVQKPNGFQGLRVVGIDTKLESTVSNLPEFVSKEGWQAIAKNEGNHIIVGAALLKKLHLKVGDTLSLYVPQKGQGKSRRLGNAKNYQFLIAGTFKIGGDIESVTAYIPIDYAQKILGINHSVTGIRLKMNDVFMAPRLVRNFGYSQAQYVSMSDWTRTQGHIYNDIQLVRMMMYLVLALVIAVACFNVVSTLVMSVRDKQSQIAILLTMGIKRLTLMQAFMVQGMLNGLVGCSLGAVFGIFIAKNLSDIVNKIEAWLGIHVLPADVYFIDFLPSMLKINDVIVAVSVALSMSFIATIYPAWKATKIEPAVALSGS
ncbi:MAG: lipoprotein-releasing ABC transporter permease subunit LolE [Parashewanella sp.]